jgi:hypothetical protein
MWKKALTIDIVGVFECQGKTKRSLVLYSTQTTLKKCISRQVGMDKLWL